MKITKLAVLVLFAAAILGSNTAAFADGSEHRALTKLEEFNYLVGLGSDNVGLKKSCIYFIGQYKIESAVDLLVEELKKSNDPEVKILAAMSLYMIGNEKGINAIYKFGVTSPNDKVKEALLTIHDEYQRVVEDSKILAGISK